MSINGLFRDHPDRPAKAGAGFAFLALSLACAVTLTVLPSAAWAANDPQPKIGVAPSQIQFGTVETSKTKSTKIKNHGKADLVVSAVTPCTDTSSEFVWASVAPVTLAPKETLKLEVSYTPVDTGEDKGCLEVASNDPKRPTVQVSLRGRAEDDTPVVAGPDIDLKPDELNFGEVPVGGSATRSFKVKNKGTESLDGVTVGRCFETSAEFSWDPADMFSVAPDENVSVRVTYLPVDEGVDEGCLSIVSNDPDENPAILDLRGTGVSPGSGLVDLDIFQFKVKKRFEAGSSDEVFVHLWVRNEGDVDEPALAVVVGMQDGLVVYEQSLTVADKGGNRGSKKYTFPSFLPTGTSEILWLAVIEDGDADVDEAFAVTQIDGPQAASVDVDLDAVRFKATKKASLTKGKRIRLKVWIENPGVVDETRVATLTGRQGPTDIYSETLEVADRPGDDAATRFNFPAYAPVAQGDIL
jgi:hypothetical protein